MDVVFSEASRPFTALRFGVRRHVPHGGHRRMVDLANLRERKQSTVVPVARLQRLTVNPSRGVGVAAHLVVLPKRFGADCPALIQQRLHLAQDERIALQGRRVVRFQVPDVVSDRLDFSGIRQAAVPLVKLRQRALKPVVHACSTRATPTHHDDASVRPDLGPAL